MTTPRSLQANRRGSKTWHVVTGVANWYSGYRSTSECGVKHCDVIDKVAKREDATLCKRCRHTLGWDLPMKEG